MNLYDTFKAVINSFGMQSLTHPFFNNSKVAIRFNIGDNGNEIYLGKNKKGYTVNKEYVSTCLDRAKRIYNSLKNAPNILVIDGYLYENEATENFIDAVTKATDLPQPQEIKEEKAFEDDEEFSHIFLCWELNEFDPDKLLNEIIMADLGSGNHFLTSSVYFICSDDNVLFHLYDDRGADLCAEKAETISCIYKQLNNLILEYAREKIDSIFKTE